MFNQTSHLSLKQKRRWSYLVIHIFMFFSGVEYSLIFPSLWEYLQHLGVPEDNPVWLGATLSAMTFTDILSGLAIGTVLDSSHNNRHLALLLNCPQILGSILYLCSISPLMLLISRLISGLGKGTTIVFLSDICRSTNNTERTPILLLFDVYFQAGLLLGPLFNFALTKVDIYTEFGAINSLNSPGLLLTIVWSIFSILVLLLYRDLVTLRQEERIEEELDVAYVTSDTSHYNIVSSQDDNLTQSNEDISLYYDTEDEVDINKASHSNQSRLPVPPNHNATSLCKSLSPREFKTRVEDIHRTKSKDNISRSPRNYGSCTARWTYDRNPLPIRKRSHSRISRKSDCFIDEAEKLMGESETASSVSSLDYQRDSEELIESEDHVLSWEDYKEVLLREEVICLSFLRFVALFCQTSLESSIPPIMERFFDYGDIANTVVYLIAGIELITICSLLSIASKYVTDRLLVSIGLILMLASLTWIGVLVPSLQEHDRSSLPFFVIGIVLELMGISIVSDVGLSLYSKLIPDHMQGFSHATRRFISQFAILLGPLWGTGALDFPQLMGIVPIVILLVGIVMYLSSFQRMIPMERLDDDENDHTDEQEENIEP
eukprot:GFUD01029439.1.p1 GENE.GFUD01029439.1~~GFUD01029439.1.p1  ORF type:complete len:604 (+),score=97.35 GFUD01029439.1:123-1934(+)